MRQLQVVEAKPTLTQRIFYPFGMSCLVLLIALFLLKDLFLYAALTLLGLLLVGYSSFAHPKNYTLRIYDAGFRLKNQFVFYQDLLSVTFEKEEEASDHLGEKTFRVTVISYLDGNEIRSIRLQNQLYPPKERVAFIENLCKRLSKRK